jgi:hypothetical protein
MYALANILMTPFDAIARFVVRQLHRIRPTYRRIFAIDEIQQQPILQWMFGAMLFYFFVSFSIWIGKPNITIEAAQNGAVCWPYFPNCGDYYFLRNLPFGYSQPTLYMAFYGLMMLIIYYMWQTRWVLAHGIMSVLLLWKLFVMFVLNYNAAGPYDYYHVFMLFMLLYVPHKEYFLKLAFVWFYFMSVTVKFTPAWIAGTYFTSMQTGIPLVPQGTEVVATNIVIFVQIIECWFLLSKNKILQRISLAFALFFHLFSGILVGYNYPSVTLPAIAILFGPLYRHTPTPFRKSAIAGWCVIALVGIFQLLGFVIPTDRYLTLEGNRFGMFMFEANHQCVATVSRHYSQPLSTGEDFETQAGTYCDGFYCLVKRSTENTATGSVRALRYESGTAWNRCDPQEWWSRLRSQCGSAAAARVALTFDHSINGGPFYRIVDVPNICDVDYKFFQHNDWIKLPPEAPVIGHPVENWYHS